jgi:branched-chain amino acid transport system ATP-binding protein
MSTTSTGRAGSAGPTARAREEPLLRVRDLHVSYAGAVRALKGVSLDVPGDDIVAVLGANGAGKTTLLRAISATLRLAGGAVTAGSVEFGGVRLDRMDPAAVVRAGVVQVPEGRQVFEELTVEENLRAGGLATPPRSRRVNRERVYELFPLLRERQAQRAGLLSGGEQQMLAIARALVRQPRVLLLDELSLGLAPVIVERLLPVVREFASEHGTAVLLVEQHVQLALEIADRGYVLSHGELVACDSAERLRADSALLTASYLGERRASG